ncbi:MAG: glycosyltransferase WbuB [Phycisphaerales bacterium]|nr:MAG: glycosyltransferase WbuB [Phycisphaerales bacterium]
MRLTILNQFYVPDISPTAHLCASLAEHRAAQGDEVTVVASWGGYVPASGESRGDASDNPRVRRVWTPRFGKATILKRCLDYATFYALATWRFVTMPPQDVIVSLTTPPYIAWAAVLHKMLHPSTKIVLWNMDCYPDAAERTNVIKTGGLLSRAMRRMNRGLFRRIDHLVCLDTAMTDLLLSQYGPRDRALPSTVIPNWEKASFFPADASPPAWGEASALGLEGKFVVLYLGNTGYGHMFETALDAAAELRGEDVVFLFVGGGSRWGEIERLAQERDLQNVVMRGYVPKQETPSVMAGASCALITLRDEALGVMSPSKLHSNLAMRLPVIYIGPEKSNVDDAIRWYGCGVSVREGDAAGVTRFVREAMADPARFEALRAEARRAFDEAYCDERTLPRFDGVLASLREEAPEPATEAAL